ncbi:MAG: O-antigen translocase [Deltaproteobacteria bacterium]|nr:O-antigen translocase [Deltaproteobacteria bacterium]
MTESKSSPVAQILRASAIVGAGSLANIVAGIIRNKVIALLLGPSGIGLYGLLYSVQSTAATVVGMGLSNSGVRQIAEAQAENDDCRLSATRQSLWLASLALGLLGSLILALLARPIAEIAIGDFHHAGAILWLSIGVLALTLVGSKRATLNGFRRLGDLTKANVLGALSGLVLALLSIWHLGLNGIPLAIIAPALTTFAVAWWFTYRVNSIRAEFSWQDFVESLRNLFSLGFVFMTTALMTAGTQLAVRVIIRETLGIEAVGHFQAAWSITTLYLGFILGAMGTDYYPRLTSVAKDQQASNNMINQQCEISLLLAGPVILAMMALAALVVRLLYSGAFHETILVLRWQLLGDLFRVASWPLPFILIAQGKGRVYFLTEFIANLVYLGSTWVFIRLWGLEGAGISFLFMYLVCFFMTWFTANLFNSFAWTRTNVFLIITLTCALMAVYVLTSFRERLPFVFALLLTLTAACYSFSRIRRSVTLDLLRSPREETSDFFSGPSL